jgi:hypothetical protein
VSRVTGAQVEEGTMPGGGGKGGAMRRGTVWGGVGVGAMPRQTARGRGRGGGGGRGLLASTAGLRVCRA